MGKPEGKRSLERPRGRWVDNIKMDHKRDRNGIDWIDLLGIGTSGGLL
jgi:hypothetical protein